MEDRGKTIMCGVLFLDIVEYSKKSVSGQISLKERFNAYLSVAIRDVPIDDRIILDTGDGAALSFLGDVGDALQVALSMRESLREGLHMEPPLLVRMGINLGPVRLVKDINGQPNIVGDGINVAQRVMGFSDPGQILVSRPYFDAVSRLSPEYAGMFHYQGSRTDKHVREHEIYAIGYPGEFTSTLTLSGDGKKSSGDLADLSKKLGKSWQLASLAFRGASLLKRVVYVAVVLVPLAALFMLLSSLWRAAPPAVQPSGVAKVPDNAQVLAASQVAIVIPASAVVATIPVSAVVAAVPSSAVSAAATSVAHAEPKVEHGKETVRETKKSHAHTAKEKKEHKEPAVAARGERTGSKAALLISCTPDTSVYVDAVLKGKTGKSPLLVPVEPGKRMVMLMTKSTVRSETIEVEAGRTVKVSPDICH